MLKEKGVFAMEEFVFDALSQNSDALQYVDKALLANKEFTEKLEAELDITID